MNWAGNLLGELKGSCPGMVTSPRAHHEFPPGVIRLPLDHHNHGHPTRIPRRQCDETEPR
ncbi:MAG: hypothetical protein ACRDRU_30180 [Pseudonocardiaceae bacterium]